MKLKFKGEAKDFLIFFVFAFFLLYLVAILVLNINSLGVNGTFSGFNPFPAFTPYFIGTTIIFYIIAIVLLAASVKSYFFETEKGFGLSFDNNQKGYSRWSKEKEMKSVLSEVVVQNKKYVSAGIPLINDGKSIWVDNGESHNLVIGSTGAGKTQCIVHPMVKVLAKKGESMIITDPKAEIYKENVGLLKSLGYKIIVLNFREPQKGNMWNPLAMPYNLYRNGNPDKSMELLDDVALNILYEEKSNSEPFWEKTSADYFVGLSLGLFDDAKPEEVNINSISLMTTVGEERFGGNSTYIKEYFNMKDPSGAAYTSASGTVMAPNETKGSIISTFKQKIRLFASRENLSEMLSQSDFDMNMIGKEKTAVFMIIQDEKKTYHALATIFVKQCYEALIDVAMSSSNGKLPIRTNFILDEFANMPPLKDVTTMITAARSREIRFTMFIQNFAQLNQVYGNENAETIRSNCGNLVYLITTELKALEEISKLCGEVKSKKDDKTASMPLVTVSDLQKLKPFECIILRLRMNPFKTKLTPNFKMNWQVPKYEEVDFMQRDKSNVQTFDIREFVKENKKSKIMDIIDNQSGGGYMPPFMPNFGQSDDKKQPFNVDDLVKKIDAKIAELEKEEELEKVASSNKVINDNNLFKDYDFFDKDINNNSGDSDKIINNKLESIDAKNDDQHSKPLAFTTDNYLEDAKIIGDVKINNEPIENDMNTFELNTEGVENKESKSLDNKQCITDDQFFDDFFDE